MKDRWQSGDPYEYFMRRVTTTGGTVAVYVRDYAGNMEFLKYFWDVAVELNPKATSLHEGKRFSGFDTDSLIDLFDRSGFVDTGTVPLVINTHFLDFDDFWNPFLGGQGPAPAYVLTLEKAERNKLRDFLYECLPIQLDDSIPMVARAWAAKGQV
jgi:hypothetical protein